MKTLLVTTAALMAISANALSPAAAASAMPSPLVSQQSLPQVKLSTPRADSGVITGVIQVPPTGLTLKYSAPSKTVKGAVTVNAYSGAFTYTPTATARHAASRLNATNFEKSDTFTVTIKDGYGGTVSVPVKVPIK